MISGALGSQLFTILPPSWLIYCFSIISAVVLVAGKVRWLAVAVLACCWCLLCFEYQLDDRLDPSLAGSVVPLTGVVSSIPQANSDYVRFLFEPDEFQDPAGLPSTLLVHWYEEWPELSVGQRWQLELKLKPPWGRVNFQGADKERWLFAQGIGGLGTVRNGQLLARPTGARFLLQSLRAHVQRQLAYKVGDARARSMVLALATADQSALANEDRRLLTATGTSHLLAISGLHVGLAAAGGIWLSRFLLWLLPFTWSGRTLFSVSITCGLLTAALYAGLAGFGTPTVRAVLMLSIAMGALAMLRAIHPLRAWVVSLAAILLLDPFAPLGAGFWFSFMAVAALLFVFLPRTGEKRWWKTLLAAQAGVVIVLLPLSAAWFYSFSPAGFLANLVAIPWVSFLVVPFVLAGIAALAFSASLAGVLWSLAGITSSILLRFLELIDQFQGQLPTLPPPSMLHVILALLGSLLLLLPRGMTGRWIGIFLLAPLFLPTAERARTGTVEVEILDVGQGTAVLVSTSEKTLLYDSGPGDGGEHNLVPGVIAPALAKLGKGAPERVVISHGDLDHAGGMRSLLHRYPRADYFVSLPGGISNTRACLTPLRWNWTGVEFVVLHPSPGLPYLGNDSSCVVSVSSGDIRILLSGDISDVVENRLVRDGLSPHPLLLVPHHGSKTSSSHDFISAIRPEVAVATASLGNRFDFPRAVIRQAYLSTGAEFWSTGECGALRLTLHPDGSLAASSARRQRDRVWRWPVAENCP